MLSSDHPHDHPPVDDQPGDAVSRRLLQGVGAVGAGLALSPAMGGIAAAGPKDERPQGDRPGRPYLYLAGDHHIHTKYSPDGIYVDVV